MGETRWLDGREQRAWRAYLGATRAVFEALDRQLRQDSGMPLTYYEILVQLSEAPEWTLRMSQLAEGVYASPSRLSHAVTRLEERGWVERSACPTDRRGQLATLTHKGFQVLAAAAPGHVEAVRDVLFDALTPEQVSQLHAISDAVRRRAQAGTDATAPEEDADGEQQGSRS